LCHFVTNWGGGNKVGTDWEHAARFWDWLDVSKLREKRLDAEGQQLPRGVYAMTRPDGSVASYKVRWREEDSEGVPRNGSRSFAVEKYGDEGARAQAVGFRRKAVAVATGGDAMPAADPSGRITVDELFAEWCRKRGTEVSERYAEDVARRWDAQVATRPLARVRLERLSQDPAALVRFQDELAAAGLPRSLRVQVLKAVRAVLRWGRRRYPNALRVEFSGLFEMPPQQPTRLAYAADATGIERIIEAILARGARDELLPLRDAAFVAAMGFTVAARPSEWLHSAHWGGLHQSSVELQRGRGRGNGSGLKTGARAALVLPSAAERIALYKERLEARFGEQPAEGLVFQSLGREGPNWAEGGGGAAVPVAWALDDYKRWTARVWRPARTRAAAAPDAPAGIEAMRFYDCRHTAISMALHSTLVSGPHGMNLHNLAGWAGHDVQTLQRYYAHIIARYHGAEPIDLVEACADARARVEATPFGS
jgi:integrase